MSLAIEADAVTEVLLKHRQQHLVIKRAAHSDTAGCTPADNEPIFTTTPDGHRASCGSALHRTAARTQSGQYRGSPSPPGSPVTSSPQTATAAP